MTNFATLILKKVKDIGINPTTRFEDIELNCGLGWSTPIKDPKSIACGGNACGVKLIYSDSKVTNFATLILRKIKEIELNLSTRFEDIEFNCGLLWFKKFRILNPLLGGPGGGDACGVKPIGIM